MKVLIAYATNSGSTEEVARAVARELGADGTTVDVCRIAEVDSLEPYSAVVVGAPMILGWHRAAQGFVKKHRQALSRVPVAYFLTAMSLTQTHEERVETVPVCVDPELAKPPHNPQRLSLKEHYATVSHYLQPALKAAPSVRPVSVAFFGGKLELFRLNVLQMLFVMLVIGAQPGDYRNWPFISQWAAGLRPALLEAAAHGTVNPIAA
jgi:menaquinone-dependent protoporphyrinogen IX oxidase